MHVAKKLNSKVPFSKTLLIAEPLWAGGATLEEAFNN
jgi:hypothetical protein